MHELIQSEIQSDIISEKSLSLPAEVFRFRSVKYTPPEVHGYTISAKNPKKVSNACQRLRLVF